MKRLLTFFALAAIVAASVCNCHKPEVYWTKEVTYMPDSTQKVPVDTTVTPADTTITPPDTTSGFTTDSTVSRIPVEPVYASDGTGSVVIIGGGASGVSAGLQCARMGVKVTIIEETPWIGGMLTSAGVTATDGNHYLRAGIFKEFEDALANYYGGYSNLASGWVSNVLFEPAVGEKILEDMCAKESNLKIVRNARFVSCTKLAKGWQVDYETKGGSSNIVCTILIDCTELGDVAKAAGVKYHVGMDAPSYGNESMAIGPNDVVQDITMVMTLKNFGRDVTIARPDNYDETKYYNCCESSYNVPFDTGQTIWSKEKMMSYGQTPKGKYMINWPIFGNDYYVNLIEMSREEREAAIKDAKNFSLGMLYFMQTKLGYQNYGMADDEYPSEDLFPFIPYHRESRRIEGKYLFTVNDAVNAFNVPDPAYRTGVAIGDYPVDHHHYAYRDWKSVRINFPSIKPFTVPLGCMIPNDVKDILVAEKSISVTNLINGSTRLQPVVMELGQAAGALAALAVKYQKNLDDVDIRKVQKELLNSKAMLQPFRDVVPGTNSFAEIQRVASTGILRGEYKTEGWSNIANFKVDNNLRWCDLYLEDYYGIPYDSRSNTITRVEFFELLSEIAGYEIKTTGNGTNIKRSEAARYIDNFLNPFWFRVNWSGHLIKSE